MRALDLVGVQYGRLTVTARAKNDPRGMTMWDCSCQCGGVITVRGTHLRQQRVVSCGCYRRTFRRKPDAEIKYGSAHDRIREMRGRPSSHLCVGCAEPAADWALRRGAAETYVGDDGKGLAVRYSGNPDDYDPMCRKCHKAYDRAST